MAAIGAVGFKIYLLWQEIGQKPGAVRRVRPSTAAPKSIGSVAEARLVSTETIVEKNLFVPERSRPTLGKVAPPSPQRRELEGLVLLGTVILEGERIAIIEVPDAPVGPRKGRTPSEIRRLAQGDTVRGFTLSDIFEDRVILKKGSSEFDLELDFSREVPAPKPGKGKRTSGRRARTPVRRGK